MGRKRPGRRKPVYLCIAVWIFFALWGCSLERITHRDFLDASGEEARVHLALGRTYQARGDFARALQENERVLALAGKGVPLDQALFSIGLIYAHPANPARDDGIAIAAFGRVIDGYPESPFAEPAKATIAILREGQRLRALVGRLDRQVGELRAQEDRASRAVVESRSREEKASRVIDELRAREERSSRAIEELKKTEERLNTIIDELKAVDIGVEQKKREQMK